VQGRQFTDVPRGGAENCSRRKRVRRSEAALDFASTVIAPMMSALAQPVYIKHDDDSSRSMTSSSTSDILERNALSRDYVTTMKNLLGVEEALESKLKNAELEGVALEHLQYLRNCLHTYRARIALAEEDTTPHIETQITFSRDEEDRNVAAGWANPGVFDSNRSYLSCCMFGVSRYAFRLDCARDKMSCLRHKAYYRSVCEWYRPTKCFTKPVGDPCRCAQFGPSINPAVD
jgi:hypothetical protein